MPFAFDVNIQKENPICHVSQSYLIMEYCFHRTNIPKSILENICLSQTPLQLQIRSHMRHNLWWFLFQKEWGEGADHITWHCLQMGHVLMGASTWRDTDSFTLSAGVWPPTSWRRHRERQRGWGLPVHYNFDDKV